MHLFTTEALTTSGTAIRRIKRALIEGMEYFDVGNHHFPSVARTALAEKLIETAPSFEQGGVSGPAAARPSTSRSRAQGTPPSAARSYRSSRPTTATPDWRVATGDDRFAKVFLSDRPDEFIHVPFGEVDAMEQALSGHDVAAVIMETISAAYGFPPAPNRDTSRPSRTAPSGTARSTSPTSPTGLMRTGEMWGISKHGIEPDILVTGKGLSGGMYPITAAILGERAAQWLDQDGFAHHLDHSAAPSSAASPRSRPWRSPAVPRCGPWCTTSPDLQHRSAPNPE